MHLEGYGVSDGLQAHRITGSQHTVLCSYYNSELLQMWAVTLLALNPPADFHSEIKKNPKENNTARKPVWDMKCYVYMLKL